MKNDKWGYSIQKEYFLIIDFITYLKERCENKIQSYHTS